MALELTARVQSLPCPPSHCVSLQAVANGLSNSVCTLFEIHSGEDATDEGMPTASSSGLEILNPGGGGGYPRPQASPDLNYSFGFQAIPDLFSKL